MKSSLVPDLVTPFSTPAATTRVRRDLEKANLELASGRHADLGLELGGRSSVLVSARSQSALLEGLKTDAAISAGRLQVAQQSLELAGAGAQDLLKSLAPLKAGQVPPEQVSSHARMLLEEFTSAINATSQGSYVFGGKNITEQPLTEYFADPPSAARTAVENAFITRFGVPPSDPATVSISAADMADFLDNDFAALFTSPQWESLWSNATDDSLMALVSLDDVVPATASANNPAIRKLEMAYVMMAGLGIETLNAEAREEVVDRAMSAIGNGIAEVDRMRGDIGFREERVRRAQDRLELQQDLIDKEIVGMEQVDLHEVAARVNELSVQLETSYSVTGRLQNLTLLSFI